MRVVVVRGAPLRLVRSLLRYQFDHAHLCSVWAGVERMLSEGDVDSGAPVAAFKVMNVMNDWQRDALGELRLEFLAAIRGVQGYYAERQMALGCLIADGAAVDPFAPDVTALLKRWLAESGTLFRLSGLDSVAAAHTIPWKTCICML